MTPAMAATHTHSRLTASKAIHNQGIIPIRALQRMDTHHNHNTTALRRRLACPTINHNQVSNTEVTPITPETLSPDHRSVVALQREADEHTLQTYHGHRETA